MDSKCHFLLYSIYCMKVPMDRHKVVSITFYGANVTFSIIIYKS
jgi:hypothetical protein